MSRSSGTFQLSPLAFPLGRIVHTVLLAIGWEIPVSGNRHVLIRPLADSRILDSGRWRTIRWAPPILTFPLMYQSYHTPFSLIFLFGIYNSQTGATRATTELMVHSAYVGAGSCRSVPGSLEAWSAYRTAMAGRVGAKPAISLLGIGGVHVHAFIVIIFGRSPTRSRLAVTSHTDMHTHGGAWGHGDASTGCHCALGTLPGSSTLTHPFIVHSLLRKGGAWAEKREVHRCTGFIWNGCVLCFSLFWSCSFTVLLCSWCPSLRFAPAFSLLPFLVFPPPCCDVMGGRRTVTPLVSKLLAPQMCRCRLLTD